jgi:hypothetical protein
MEINRKPAENVATSVRCQFRPGPQPEAGISPAFASWDRGKIG